MGTSWDTDAAAIAPIGIDEGRLVGVELQDRFAATDLTRQALATCVTEIINYVGYGRHLRLCCVYDRHFPLHCIGGNSRADTCISIRELPGAPGREARDERPQWNEPHVVWHNRAIHKR